MKPLGKINLRDEFLLTFSTRKSLFSSKKIERFIVFWTFLILTTIYMILNMRRMEAWDFVEISALWLAYGGVNSLIGLREKRLDNQDSSGGVDIPS